MLLEAARSGLPWLAAATIALVLGLSAFLSQVALTESRALQTAVVAAVLRAGAVFIIAAHVASSTLREMNDKGLELLLALPLPRTTLYLGRLLGFAACAALLSLAFALPLALWTKPAALACWTISLACEAALAAAAALFFSITLAQLVPAMAATAGLYLLSRSIGTLQAIASGPLAEPSFAAQAQRAVLDGIAFVLPDLERVTRSEWLLYGAPAGMAYLAGLASLALYALLLVAAGLVDFRRRNL